MFHQIEAYHHQSLIGHLEVLQHIRPPSDADTLRQFENMVMMTIRTKSFLYQVRSGDFNLRQIGETKIVIEFADERRPAEIGMIVGFTPTDLRYACDEEDVALSQTIVGDKREFGPDVSALDPIGSLLAALRRR